MIFLDNSCLVPQTALLKDGLYTFNASTNTVRVLKGEARVFPGTTNAEVKVKEDHQFTFGASPRASLALFQAGRSLAWLRGLDYLSPDLVQELAPDVLRHRIGLTYEAEAQEITPDAVITQVVSATPVPSV